MASNNTVSVGTQARAGGGEAIAIGTGATADGIQSIAVGTGNTVAAYQGAAYGSRNTVGAGAANTVVVGNGIVASQANNVVLGNASADRAAQQVVGATVGNSAGGTIGFGGFAGVAVGVASVGAAGSERQLVNVAPGAIHAASTDAINGSQLYSVASGLGQLTTNVGTSITQVLGGTTVYNPSTGSISGGIQIGGNTFSVQQAISTVYQGGVRYDVRPDGSTDYGSVTLAGSGGTQVRNLAPGTAGTDAVNLNQLQATAANLQGQISTLDNRVATMGRALSGGIAASSAMAVVTPVEAGRYHLTGAVAAYNGQVGVGMNLLKRSDNGQTTLHAGVGWGSGGSKPIARVGFGFSFD